MSITNILYHWLDRFSSRTVSTSGLPTPTIPCFLDLPNDILVELVFDDLDVRDIICLRRVCMRLYKLTHHSIIWKRLLQRIDVPCPPVPPTTRYSYANLTGFEAEQIVTRAYSLEVYWKQPLVTEERAWKFEVRYHVLHAYLLPGSHYMVASVAERSFKRYYICIFVVEPKAEAYVLARTEVWTKAFHVVARYMTVGGEKGIAVAFVRRDYKHERDRLNAAKKRGTDISMFSVDYEIDSDVKMRWEAQALHIPLESLETLADPRIRHNYKEFSTYADGQPPPFRQLMVLRSGQKLGIPSLDEIHGLPYFAISKGDNTMVFKNLDRGASALIYCSPTLWGPPENHKIMGLRLVGPGNQVLVARSIKVYEDHYMFGIEAFDVPRCLDHKTEVEVESDEGQYLDHVCAETVRISEYGIRPHDDDSILASLTTPDAVDLRPVSFYVTTKINGTYDRGILHLAVFPMYTPPEVAEGLIDEMEVDPFDAPPGPAAKYTHWTYPLIPENIRCERFWWRQGDRRVHVLPGAHRNVIYHTDLSDRDDQPMVMQLYRIYHPVLRYNLGPIPPEEDGDNAPKELAKIDLPWDIIRECGRFGAVAWDETIGRLIIAHPSKRIVHVMDYAASPRVYSSGERYPINLDLTPDPEELHVPKPPPPPIPEPQPPVPPLGSAENPLDLDKLDLDDPDLNLHVGPAVYLGVKPREIRRLVGPLDWMEARPPPLPHPPRRKRGRQAINRDVPTMPGVGEAGPSNLAAHGTDATMAGR